MINKEDLSEEEVIQCQQCIYKIVGLESRHELLNLPNMGHRLKGNKKDEQYRLLWSELEILVSNTGNSKGHKSILDCIRECRAKGTDQITDKIDVDPSLKDTEESGSSHENSGSHRASVIRTTTDSPMSPPHTNDISTLGKKKTTMGSGNKTLLDIINSTERIHNQKRLDFSGRLCTPPGQMAKLYPNLLVKDASGKEMEAK